MRLLAPLALACCVAAAEAQPVTCSSTADGSLTVNGKITAKVSVPDSFASLADVQSYLASILT